MTTMRLAYCRTLSSLSFTLLTRVHYSSAWMPQSRFVLSNFLLKMEENMPNTLSTEELRCKRLAALSGESTAAAAAAESSASFSTSTTTVSASRTQVVDLCSDSSDEDEETTNAVRKPAARRSVASSSIVNIDSDTDDDEALLKQFYQEKKEKRKEDTENERPAAKKKRSSSSKPTVAKKAASSKKAKESSVKTTSSSTQQSTLLSESTSTLFQVASWNVWFGPQNLPAGQPHASARMKALARHLLHAHNPDTNPLWAIGFQEVIDELAVHLFPLLEHAGYQIFRQPDCAYGCAIAIYTRGPKACTLLDASWQPYQATQMDRGFMYARIQLPFSGKQVLFTTTHLESWINTQFTGTQQRQRQLQELESFCNEQMQTYPSLKSAIMTGDMNWDDERPRATGNDPVMSTVLRTPWNDSFLSTRTSARDMGYTYDAKENPMLGGNLRRRFDRCLVRNTFDGSVQVNGTQLVGKEALVSLTWKKLNPFNQTYKEVPTAPSDHFGLIVQMTT